MRLKQSLVLKEFRVLEQFFIWTIRYSATVNPLLRIDVSNYFFCCKEFLISIGVALTHLGRPQRETGV